MNNIVTGCDGRDARTKENDSSAEHFAGAETGNQFHSASTPIPAKTPPLGLPGVMDAEGRVDESRLRAYIVKNGGLCPSERAQAWRFLFGMFPCSSTALERPLLREQLAVRYEVMKTKWQRLLPGCVRLRLNGTDAELVAAVKYYEQRKKAAEQLCQEESEELKERLSFLELQAQVVFSRVTFDVGELQEAIRIIDKDVPRTDRDLAYYLGEGSGNLLVLREILITYAAFHPEVSYAQGMNDLCSRFLEVLDSEVDTYWSFARYMEKFSRDFRADGLHRKIELEAELLKELDPHLYAHLATDNMDRLTFCHRWLLLGFQREFEHSDALRLFEILSCDHLELISQQVERAHYRERLACKRSLEDRRPAAEAHAVNAEFTFELFICAAILLQHRDTLLRHCTTESAVQRCVSVVSAFHHHIIQLLFAEFHRINNVNLRNQFYRELDRRTPKLITLYREKAAKTNKIAEELCKIMRIYDLQEQRDVDMRRALVLRALPVYLREDASQFFKTCKDLALIVRAGQ